LFLKNRQHVETYGCIGRIPILLSVAGKADVGIGRQAKEGGGKGAPVAWRGLWLELKVVVEFRRGRFREGATVAAEDIAPWDVLNDDARGGLVVELKRA
jgi:hypothetical protein